MKNRILLFLFVSVVSLCQWDLVIEPIDDNFDIVIRYV